MREPRIEDHPPLARHIQATALFSSLSDTELQAILALSRQYRVMAGELVFRQFESCAAFYLLLKGAVKLYRERLVGREKAIAFVRPGQTFAEAAMFSGGGYPVNAMALEDCELVAFDCYRFTRYMQTHSEVTWKILATLSSHLHHLTDQIETLSTHNAEQKVAVFLLEHYDPEAGQGLVEGIPQRRTHLANMLGIKPETLCRVLTKFEQHGWIAKDGSNIHVLDGARLSQTLGQGQAYFGN